MESNNSDLFHPAVLLERGATTEF